MDKFDILVFCGRFQPLHLGHELIIDLALRNCNRLVVLVGSANRSLSMQNPFTFLERKSMIESPRQLVIHNKELVIHRLNDYLYNDAAWVSAVQRKIRNESELLSREISYRGRTPKVGLVGFSKDSTSYYLKMFPQWGAIDIPTQHSTFNSTDIRNEYFRNLPRIPKAACSPHVVDFLKKYIYTDVFKDRVLEAEHIRHYKSLWQHSPFPPTFNTVDNVVIQSGHILLVERGEQPGKGLLALPGGFINPNESLEESAVRELKEETKISDGRGEIPPGVLKSFITKRETFDEPRRSTRGRTITEAFLYELPAKEKLYSVRGSDDAAFAKWYPIGTVAPERFFEDHFFIVCKMLGLTVE